MRWRTEVIVLQIQVLVNIVKMLATNPLVLAGVIALAKLNLPLAQIIVPMIIVEVLLVMIGTLTAHTYIVVLIIILQVLRVLHLYPIVITHRIIFDTEMISAVLLENIYRPILKHVRTVLTVMFALV
jgi:hypothetical protein